MEQNIINILKTFREQHEKNSKIYKWVFIILISLLMINISVISLVANYIEAFDIFSWIGLWVLIVALGFTLKGYITENNYITTIDYFYNQYGYKKSKEKENINEDN